MPANISAMIDSITPPKLDITAICTFPKPMAQPSGCLGP